MNGTVLVVGAGVAGMRAAAELVQRGFRVTLLAAGNEPGGTIAGLDVLPPTMEHAACALQPLYLLLRDNPDVALLTSAEVLSLAGCPGEFQAIVLCDAPGDRGERREVGLAVDAVIVATEPVEGTDGSLVRLGLELDEDGSLRMPRGHPAHTSREGVFACRAAGDPDRVAESVIAACAAASNVAALLAPVRRAGRIAVIIDLDGHEDGPGLRERIDLDDLAAHARTLPGVEAVEVAACASDGSAIGSLLGEGELNRLVVAGPSPITHETRFGRHAEAAGLNRFLVEIVNLQDQCARVHPDDRAAATRKARTLLKMGVARARRLEPLEDVRVDVVRTALIVGAGPAGVACAAALAAVGIDVHLVEAAAEIADLPRNDHPLVKPLVARLTAEGRISIHAPATVGAVEGRVGDFRLELARGSGRRKVRAGAIVLASAAALADADGAEAALALERDDDGRYRSTQGILNPQDAVTDGVYLGGPARADLRIEDAVVDGEAAASRVACVLSLEVLVRPAVISSVDDLHCDGCAYCVEPCPTRSITLLEFAQESGTRKVVEVSDRTCIGCGVCMATCPKDGIFVRHFRLESFSEMVRAALEDASPEDGPLILAFCCNRCAYPGADEAGVAGIPYPTGVRIIRMVCAGMIHPNTIVDALTGGADGVLLCGCHDGECRSREGIRRALARSEAIALLLEDFGLEEERFRLEHIAASEGAKFARVACEMTEQLAALGTSPYRQGS